MVIDCGAGMVININIIRVNPKMKMVRMRNLTFLPYNASSRYRENPLIKITLSKHQATLCFRFFFFRNRLPYYYYYYNNYYPTKSVAFSSSVSLLSFYIALSCVSITLPFSSLSLSLFSSTSFLFFIYLFFFTSTIRGYER